MLRTIEMVGVQSINQAVEILPSAELSFEEYLLLPHTEGRAEFVDGRVIKMTEPTLRHIRIIKHITSSLDRYFSENSLDLECYGGPGVQVPVPGQRDRVRDPDLIVATRAQWQKVAAQTKAVFLKGNTPSLAIEVCSPSTVGVDLEDKVTEYAATGIQEYWIVNPLAGYVRVYQLVNEHYQIVGESEGDTVVSPLLNKLALTADFILCG